MRVEAARPRRVEMRGRKLSVDVAAVADEGCCWREAMRAMLGRKKVFVERGEGSE